MPVSRLKGEVLVMATMTNTQRKRVHFKVKNRRGGPAKFDGTPEWFSDNSDVLRLEPAADGMSCYVYAVGPLTDSPVNVTMRADADLGAGVRPLLGTISFEITAGEAALIELQDDPAEEEPDEELNPPGGTGTGGGGSPVDQGNAGDTGGTVETRHRPGRRWFPGSRHRRDGFRRHVLILENRAGNPEGLLDVQEALCGVLKGGTSFCPPIVSRPFLTPSRPSGTASRISSTARTTEILLLRWATGCIATSLIPPRRPTRVAWWSARVSYVARNRFGIPDGYCVMALKEMTCYPRQFAPRAPRD
jgi:hypothetical protein